MNIIIFSDGTSNTKSTDTNVYQFYKALRNDPNNLCYYDRGVGSFKLDVLGKAFGTGLADNIRECYGFLVEHYQPDDRLFLFGFSRGAYTVRSLANFATMVGLVEKNPHQRTGGPSHHQRNRLTPQERSIRKAFNVYRANKIPDIFKQSLRQLRKANGLRECKVFGLGVWDTVGAIGLPRTHRDRAAYGEHYYHRVTLPKDIVKACHALAIDDERREFAPVMFNKTNNAAVEEVWFPGMHSDVGGGYRTTKQDPGAKALSNISLHWMADHFGENLNFDRRYFGKPQPLGPMHDSMLGAADAIYSKRIRTIREGSRLHESVIDRIKGPLSVASASREPDRQYIPRALRMLDLSRPPHYGLKSFYKVVS